MYRRSDCARVSMNVAFSLPSPIALPETPDVLVLLKNFQQLRPDEAPHARYDRSAIPEIVR
jgi:hypothetical protein